MYITSRVLAKALMELVEERPDKEKEIVENFINFCHNKNLINRLPKILTSLEKLSSRLTEEKRLVITTKEKISESIVTKIKSFTAADNKTEIKTTEDPTIKGGFIAKYNGKIYDASIVNQINKFKSTLQKVS